VSDSEAPKSASVFVESYSDKKCISAEWEAEWSGKVYAAHGSKHSKGVMFLMNPNFDCQVENCIKDKNGRFIILAEPAG